MVSGLADHLLRLSPDQLHALLEELYAVIERYRTAEPGPDAHRIYFYLHAIPQRHRGNPA